MEISVVRARAQATRDVQAELAALWSWPEKTLAQWDTDLALLTEKERAETASEQEEHAIRAQRNVAYKALERFTMQALAALKVSVRGDTAALETLKRLPGQPFGRPQSLARAKAVAEAWKTLRPALALSSSHTHAAFESALAHAADLDATTSAAKAKWRHAAETLAEHAAHLDSDNKAWFALASRLYGPETPEGALIRSRVPVTGKS